MFVEGKTPVYREDLLLIVVLILMAFLTFTLAFWLIIDDCLECCNKKYAKEKNDLRVEKAIFLEEYHQKRINS